jgi:hypothetical protein
MAAFPLPPSRPYDHGTKSGRERRLFVPDTRSLTLDGTEISVVDPSQRLNMKLTPVKFWRLRRGVLQIVLAQQAGIPRSRMSEIECGHVAARHDELRRIAAALKVSTEALEITEDSTRIGTAGAQEETTPR